MKKIKTINSEKVLQKQLKNKTFKKEYEYPEKEFEIAREIIKLRSGGTILFDGVCNLCNSSVNFIIERDKKKHFTFARVQSEKGQQLLQHYHLNTTTIDTIILLEDNKTYDKSTAALKIAKQLAMPWPMFYSFIVLPRFARDFLYNIIAKNRYRWFGKLDTCLMPSPELQDRFLEYIQS